MSRAMVLSGWALLLGSACTGPTWQAYELANGDLVAKALNDPADLPPPKEEDPASIPVFDAPKRLRPCCAFGMDLKAKVGPIPVPGYEKANITSVDKLGPHGYDHTGTEAEHDGLIYTCRGGFIDTAHIRDNADRTLYLATRIARGIPAAVSVDLPEEGTRRRVIVKPLPEGLLDRRGRWSAATKIAEWANYQLSLWHEIVTWYGWQDIPGYSEKVSAFSPEDLYSNVLGQKLTAGLIMNRESRSREQYDQAVSAWIREALRRLGAVSKEDGRMAMKAVDGLWWDSSKALPEWKLVTHRYVTSASSLSPWKVTDALPEGQASAPLQRMCAHQAPPLALEVPERIGDQKIEDLVTIELTFAGWVPSSFPLPAKKGKVVTQVDFPTILADIRREGAEKLGADFDRVRNRAPRENADPETTHPESDPTARR